MQETRRGLQVPGAEVAEMTDAQRQILEAFRRGEVSRETAQKAFGITERDVQQAKENWQLMGRILLSKN